MLLSTDKEDWRNAGATDVTAKIDNGGPSIRGVCPGPWDALERRLSREYQYVDDTTNGEGARLIMARPLDHDPAAIDTDESGD